MSVCLLLCCLWRHRDLNTVITLIHLFPYSTFQTAPTIRPVSVWSATSLFLCSPVPPPPPTMARNIRSRALQQIAALSASNPAASFDQSDLDKLCRVSVKQGHSASGAVNGHGPSSPSSVPPAGPDVGRIPMVRRQRSSAPQLWIGSLTWFLDYQGVRGSSRSLQGRPQLDDSPERTEAH